MSNLTELRAVKIATEEENIAEQKMIAAEKAVVEATIVVEKITEQYEKAVKVAVDVVSIKSLSKLERELSRVVSAKVSAQEEAKRVIEVDIRKANKNKVLADRDLKFAQENPGEVKVKTEQVIKKTKTKQVENKTGQTKIRLVSNKFKGGGQYGKV